MEREKERVSFLPSPPPAQKHLLDKWVLLHTGERDSSGREERELLGDLAGSPRGTRPANLKLPGRKF